MLAIATASPRAEVGLLEGDRPLAIRRFEGGIGLGARLADAVRALLDTDGRPPALVAVLLGPGGFTGLRTGLSLAHGLALGFGCGLAGATLAEALSAELDAGADPRPLWVCTASRRGTVFLEAEGGVRRLAVDAVDPPATAIRLGGDAADALLDAMPAARARIAVVEPRVPGAVGVARAALARHRGLLPARAAVPLYVEPPETSLPATAPRPPPRE